MWKAILIEEKQPPRLTELDDTRLPEGDVTIAVTHSTLNYKDGLALTGKSPVVRTFPMVPGIDLAGVVEASTHPSYRVGDAVLVNGQGMGETRWGGLAEKARLPGDALTKTPAGMSAAEAMEIGTAGYTAMLCVMALEKNGLSPKSGDVLVTGASGGVGGIALQLLHRAGYRVVASTGRPEEADYLKKLGADEIIDRKELAQPGKPLQKMRWAGAIDSVGSVTLANICASTKEEGVVAACGLAQGMDFPATVAPFILRNITLAGVCSVHRPQAVRDEAWRRLATELDRSVLATMTQTIRLEEAISNATPLIEGKVRGRLVVAIR